MSRKEVGARLVAVGWKKCSACHQVNVVSWKVCRGCGGMFRKRAKKKKPARGSTQRDRLELRHAQRMSQQWATRVKTAVAKWDEWTRKARAVQARIDRRREQEPKARAVRGIKLGGGLE